MDALFKVVVFVAILLVLTPILGNYLAAIYHPKPPLSHPFLRKIERLCYRMGGAPPNTK